MVRNFEYIQQAKAMKEVYTDILKDYSILEIVDIWESYSESYSAGWVTPSKDRVAEAFN